MILGMRGHLRAGKWSDFFLLGSVKNATFAPRTCIIGRNPNIYECKTYNFTKLRCRVGVTCFSCNWSVPQWQPRPRPRCLDAGSKRADVYPQRIIGNIPELEWPELEWRLAASSRFSRDRFIFSGGFGFPFFYGYPYYGYYPYDYYGYGYGYDPYGYDYYGGSAYGYGYGDQGYGYGDQGYGYGNRYRGGSSVVELQRRLARAGYYHGAIDGIMGPATRRALRAYERTHNQRGYGMTDRY